MSEIEHAIAEKAITLHTKIKYRWHGVDEDGKSVPQWYDTTPGRVILGQVIPRSHKVPFDAVNKLMTKREISKLIDTVYRHCGQKDTVIFCDRIMALGFYHAFKAGISFGKDDMVVPTSKWKIVDGDAHRSPRSSSSSSTRASSPRARSTTRWWTPGRSAPTRSPRR